jgi:hypothetical protein
VLLLAGLMERGVFFAFFCLGGSFSELLAGGLWEAAFGDGLGEAFDGGDGDLSEVLGERLRALLFFLGLLFFFFCCTFVGEASTAAAATADF